jgi:hypothetical protein
MDKDKYKIMFMKRMIIGYIMLFAASIIVFFGFIILLIKDTSIIRDKFVLIQFIFVESCYIVGGIICFYKYKKVKNDN